MSLIDDITNFVLSTGRIFESIETLVTDTDVFYQNVRLELRHIQQFQFDPKWKNRVINVPKAVNATRDMIVDLIDEVRGAFESLVSNLKAIRSEFGTAIPGERGGGVIHLLDRLNKIRQIIVEIDEGIKALDTFLDALRTVREQIEGLDSLFLQQGNLRRYIHAVDGEVLKVRIGELDINR